MIFSEHGVLVLQQSNVFFMCWRHWIKILHFRPQYFLAQAPATCSFTKAKLLFSEMHQLFETLLNNKKKKKIFISISNLTKVFNSIQFYRVSIHSWLFQWLFLTGWFWKLVLTYHIQIINSKNSFYLSILALLLWLGYTWEDRNISKKILKDPVPLH